MKTAVPLSVLGDLPDRRRDLLGYAPYARALASIIDDPRLETPYTIGIYGPWGTGKTSFMSFIDKASVTTTQDHVIWFQPWLFDNKEEVWKALLYTAIQHLEGVRARHDITSEDQAERLSRLFIGLGRLTLNTVLATIPGNTSSLDDLSKAFGKTERDATQFINTFRWEFRALKDEILGRNLGNGESARLLIFVDDLDRCTPESCIMALEAIKLFLDMPGCVFVLGIDRDLVQRGVEIKYGEQAGISGEQYLEKLVQLPFHLPPVRAEAFTGFLGTVTEGLGFTPATLALLALASEQNPRRAKRLASCLNLVRSVARELPFEDASTLEDDKVATVLILQVRFPLEYLWLTQTPHSLPQIATSPELATELTAFLTTAIGDRRAEVTARRFLWFLGRPELADFTDRGELDRYMRLSTVLDVAADPPETSSLVDLLDSRMIRAATPEEAAEGTTSEAPTSDVAMSPLLTGAEMSAQSISDSIHAARKSWDHLRATSLLPVMLGLRPLSRLEDEARALRVEVDAARDELDALRRQELVVSPGLTREVRGLEAMDAQRVIQALGRGAAWLALTTALLAVVAYYVWFNLTTTFSSTSTLLVIIAIASPVVLRAVYVTYWARTHSWLEAEPASSPG